MEYDRQILSLQLAMVESFVEHLAYHRGLFHAWDVFGHPSLFWSATVNGHLYLALIAWCKVFGSPREDIYWEKLPTGVTAGQAIREFRRRILDKTSMSEQKWTEYHRSMREMRDKFVVHRDVHKPVSGNVPVFDDALKVAYAYEEWVKEYLMSGVATSPGRLSSRYWDWYGDARSIMSQQVWR